MTLIGRRILYVSTFVIFFVLTPLLIFYASGYRYDFRQQRLTTVGALYIKSYPAGSSIYIDGVDTMKRTPNRILNLLPGFHMVSVTRDGYEPWKKTLEVKASETTFVRDIVLFLSEAIRSDISTGGRNFILNRNETTYAYQDTDDRIHFTSLINEADYLIETPQVVQEMLAVSPTGDHILYSSTNSDWHVINVNTERTTDLGIRGIAKKIQWDPQNHDKIWILRNDVLSSIDLISKSESLHSSAIVDYALVEGNVLVLRTSDNGFAIEITSTFSSEPTAKYSIQTSEPLRFARTTPASMITLASDRSIWLLNTTTGLIRQLDAQFHDWHDRKLLFGTMFELHAYFPESDSSILIDRSSEPTDNILWHPSGSYFLRLKGSEIAMIEMDGRDIRNSVILSTDVSPQSAFAFDQKGSKLFILGPSNNTVLTIQ